VNSRNIQKRTSKRPNRLTHFSWTHLSNEVEVRHQPSRASLIHEFLRCQFWSAKILIKTVQPQKQPSESEPLHLAGCQLPGGSEKYINLCQLRSEAPFTSHKIPIYWSPSKEIDNDYCLREACSNRRAAAVMRSSSKPQRQISCTEEWNIDTLPR
jgi:hypothetical protein